MTTTPAQRRRRARMKQAVELREKGWSLRAIAAHLGVDHKTVSADLSRWQEVGNSVVGNSPPRGGFSPPEFPSNVLHLRRKAG
jgi:transposase